MSLHFERGWYSATGSPAYAVLWRDGGEEDILGLVWKDHRRGQRDGDWTLELNGGSYHGRHYMTRVAAAKALEELSS